MIVVLAIGILLGLVLALLFIKGYKSTTIIFSIIVLAAGMVFFKEGQDSKQEQQNQVKLANRNDDENNDTNLETKKSIGETNNQSNNTETSESSNQGSDNQVSRNNNYNTGLKEKYLAELDALTRETEETGDEDIPWIEVRKQAVEKYDLWDDKLNEIYGGLKQQLSSTEMEAVKQEERQWIKDRDAAVKQVEIEEGPGTLAPYAMTMTKLDMTRDRCYELVNLYLK